MITIKYLIYSIQENDSMYGYVYKTTDLRNGKIYVGRHKSDEFDSSYFGSGNIIKRIIENNSTDILSCEILQECYSHDEMCNAEKYWIAKLDSKNPEIGYNIADGGEFGYSGGMTGHHQSDKQKRAASIACSYKRSDETRKKLSIALQGNKNASGNKGRKGTFIGRHHSQETKDILRIKCSEKAKLQHQNMSEEEKIARGNKISNSKKGKIVITDGINNKYIDEKDWLIYEDQGFYKMSIQAYNKLINQTS